MPFTIRAFSPGSVANIMIFLSIIFAELKLITTFVMSLGNDKI